MYCFETNLLMKIIHLHIILLTISITQLTHGKINNTLINLHFLRTANTGGISRVRLRLGAGRFIPQDLS